MGASGVGLAKALDKLNDLRKLRKAKQGTCCFVAGTPIRTADGYARIEDLEIVSVDLQFSANARSVISSSPRTRRPVNRRCSASRR